MKLDIRTSLTMLALLISSALSYAQGNKAQSKVYTIEEVARMCSPVDTAEVRIVLAKEDSMYKAYLSMKRKSAARVETVPDWRSMMGPVAQQDTDYFNQDCWAHAAASVVEGQLHIALGSNIHIFLSAYDIVYGVYGDNNIGSNAAVGLDYIKNSRVLSYAGPYPNLQGAKWGIVSYTTMSGITNIKAALTNGPVTASFYVNEDFVTFFNDPSNATAVYRYDGQSALVGGHEVVIVSYDDSQQCWLCKNDWGSDWADGGYFRIGFGERGIEIRQNCQVTVSQACYAKIVPNLIGPLSTALGYSWGNGEHAYVLGNTTASSNTTVPTGRTLSLSSGSTLTFSGYYKLRIEGALLASGSSSSPVTFQGNGSSGSWFGIEFYNVSGGSSLRYCTIKDASYGLNLISSYLPPNPLVIRNNNRGVNCTNYSDPSFMSTVFDYNSYDVYGDGTSTPLLGTSTGSGYNSFRDPGYYQVYSTYSGTISAEGNWWGSSPAYPVVTSNVDYANWLSADPNPSLRQTGGKSGVVVQSMASSSSGAQNSQTNIASSDSGMAKLDAAYRLYLGGDYKNALQAFQSVVADYPNDFSGCRALVFAERCLDRLGSSSGVLTELNDASASHSGTRVGSFAEARRTYQYLRGGKYQEAAAQALQTEGSTNDTTLVKFALYDAGSINWYDLGNKQSGEEYYRQLISRFPGDPLSASALVATGETAKPPSPQQEANTVAGDEGVALRNYPNPFNPTTTISYNLKLGGQVTLKVYDVLGREVATLVDGLQNPGFHVAQFGGQNLASGIYLYRLTAPGVDQVMKMILMK